VKYRHCHGTTAAASRRESRRAVAAAAACKEIFLFYVEISFKWRIRAQLDERNSKICYSTYFGHFLKI